MRKFTAEQIETAQGQNTRTSPEDIDPRIETQVSMLIGRVADRWTMLILDILAEKGEMRFTLRPLPSDRPFAAKDRIGSLCDVQTDPLPGIASHAVSSLFALARTRSWKP